MAGALLTLLALGLVAPGMAQASCSHNVVPKGQAERGIFRLGSDLLAGLQADAAEAGSTKPERCPCSGPQCSENRSDRQAPGFSEPLTVDEWCNLGLAFGFTPSSGWNPISLDSAVYPLISPSCLDRPPR